MKILLAPSETKTIGGENPPFDTNSFIFSELFSKREEALKIYNNYINSCSDEELSKIFGIKDINKAKEFQNDIFTLPTKKAVLRYTGVAYDHLDYPSLNKEEQNYINEHVLIFSNIFGPILAKDFVPNYKLKQGEKIDGFAFEKHYKENFSETLDKYLEDEDILDIRAGFYDKFYIPNKSYTTLKFLKGGKVVSHWAKAYRGLVLREVAKHSINSIDELMRLNIANLNIEEIKIIKNKRELVYSITE